MIKGLFTFTKFALFIAFLAPLSAGKLDRSKPPQPGPAPTIELGEYETFQMANGLKVFVVESKKLPRVSIALVLEHSPVLEGESVGFASATGQLLVRGTKTRNKAKLDEDIDFIGASINTTPNGLTASSLRKHRDEMFAIVADILLHSEFTQEELDKIKFRMLSNLKAGKDDPDTIAANVRDAVLYGKDHPYGEVITEESVEKITLEDCRAYYQTYFRPNIGYLAMVGDINVAEAKALVEKYLGNWTKGPVPNPSYPTPQAPSERRVAIVDKAGAVQTVLNLLNIFELKPGSPDAIKTLVTNTILGGGSEFRLYDNLREDKGYTYGAYSTIETDPLVAEFRASAKVRNEVTKPSVVEFLAELNRIRDEDVSSDELRLAKNFLSGSFARSLENPQTVATFAIDTARYQLPADYYQNYLKEIEAVSLADVRATANKYIDPEHAYILAVGNSKELSESLAEFGKVEQYDALGNTMLENTFAIPAGVTATTVLADYIKALGGKEKLMSLTDLTIDGSILAMGMKLPFQRQQKTPNMVMAKADMNGNPVFKQIFNGTKGVVMQMGQSQKIEGETLETLKVDGYLVPEMHYAELSVKTSLIGTEMVDGKPAYQIERELPNGSKSVHIFDVGSGLKVKEISPITTPQGEMSQIVTYSDYREVDGVKMPFKTVQSRGPQTFEFTTDSIKFNQALGDDVFIIP